MSKMICSYLLCRSGACGFASAIADSGSHSNTDSNRDATGNDRSSAETASEQPARRDACCPARSTGRATSCTFSGGCTGIASCFGVAAATACHLLGNRQNLAGADLHEAILVENNPRGSARPNQNLVASEELGR